jgi:hypothetical protein
LVSASSKEASLPLRWQGTPDGRSRGRLIQFVRDYLAERPEGASRAQLDDAARGHYGDRFPRTRRSMQEMIYRLKRGGEIDERDGKLVARRLVRTTRGRHG